MTTIQVDAVERSRDDLLRRVVSLKKNIAAHLESGDRDFASLRRLIDDYADAQHAADVLSGQTRISA